MNIRWGRGMRVRALRPCDDDDEDKLINVPQRTFCISPALVPNCFVNVALSYDLDHWQWRTWNWNSSILCNILVKTSVDHWSFSSSSTHSLTGDFNKMFDHFRSLHWIAFAKNFGDRPIHFLIGQFEEFLQMRNAIDRFQFEYMIDVFCALNRFEHGKISKCQLSTDFQRIQLKKLNSRFSNQFIR